MLTSTKRRNCRFPLRFSTALVAIWVLLIPAAGAQISFLYVLEDAADGNVIRGFRISEVTGALANMDSTLGFPVVVGQNGSGFGFDRFLCLDPANDRLYAVNYGSRSISGYSINRSSGELTELPFSPFPVFTTNPDPDSNNPFNPTACDVHPSGSPLLVAIARNAFNAENGFVASINITDSSATEAAGSPYATDPVGDDGPSPNGVTLSQDGNYAYAGGAGSSKKVAAFSVNQSTGVLTVLSASPFDIDHEFPRDYLTDSSGRVFLSSGFGAALEPTKVRVFTTSNGELTEVASTASGLDFGVNSVLHPNNFLMVADRGAFSSNSDKVGVYEVSGTGGSTTIARVTGSPFSTGPTGRGTNLLVLSGNNQFLFVGHSETRNIARFAVNATTGALTREHVQDPGVLDGRPSGMSYVTQEVVCGDGTIDLGLDPVPKNSAEVCDDGNDEGGDGCSADCQVIEPNYECPVPGEPCIYIPSADLSVTKTDGATSATPGQTITYTIVASNAGPDESASVVLTDVFPPELSCSYTSVPAGGATGNTSSSGNLNETLVLPSTSSVTYTATCTIDASATGTLSNMASITGELGDPTLANNSATDDDTVLTPSADLSVSKTDNQASTTPGSSLTYEIAVTNLGPSDAPGSTLVDNFPAGLSEISWTCLASAGSACPGAGAGPLNESIAVAAGGTVTFTVTATVDDDFLGSLVNTAIATSGVSDQVPGNDQASDTTTVISPADVQGIKTVASDGLPGGLATYTIVLQNDSSNAQFDDPLSDEFSDTLPEGLEVLSASASDGSEPVGTVEIVGNTVTYNGPIAGNGQVILTIEAFIRQSAADSTLANQGLVFFDADGDGANDSLRSTDDPDAPGAEDETLLVVLPLLAIPTAGGIGLVLFALLLVLGAVPLIRQ